MPKPSKQQQMSFIKKLYYSLATNRILPLVLFLLTVVSGIFVVFSLSIGINHYDLYDYVEGVFWAEATLRSHSLINPDYVYFYLVPFGSNIIMAPFVRLFGVGFLANQLGMLVYFILYLAVVYFLACALYPNTRQQLLFCTIVSLFVYTYIGDNLLHHLLSYGIGFLCFMGELSCLIRIRNGKKGLAWVLLIVFVLWSSVNGIVTVALSGGPVLLAFIIDQCFRNSLSEKRNLRLICTIAATTVIGLLLYRYIDHLANSLNMYKYRFMLADPDELVTHITHDFFADYLRLFSYNPNKDFLFNLKGLYALCKLAFAIVMAALPIFLWKTNKKTTDMFADNDTSLILLASSLVILVCIGQYILFYETSLRYLFNGVLALFLIAAVLFEKLTDQNLKRLGMILLTIAVCLFSFKTVVYPTPYGKNRIAGLENISEILTENGLSYGYVTYRHYKVLEIVSAGQQRNAVISYDEDAGRYCVDYDRIYLEELKKPAGIDKFYILKHTEFDETLPEDVLLEETCTSKIDLGYETIYIFPMEDWEKVMAEK